MRNGIKYPICFSNVNLELFNLATLPLVDGGTLSGAL